MPEQSRRHGADRTAIGEWLARLEVARSLRHLYEGDHRATRRAREQLWEATRRLPEKEVVLLVSPAGFELPGRSLGVLAKASTRLASQLWRLGIKALRIRPPVVPDAIDGLLRLLTDLRDKPTEEDRSRILEEEKGIAGVDLLPVVLDGMLFVEDEEPRGGPASPSVAPPYPADGDAIDQLLALLDRPAEGIGDGSDLLLAMDRVFGGVGAGRRGMLGDDGASVLDGVDDLFDADGGSEESSPPAAVGRRPAVAGVAPRRARVPVAAPPGWRPPAVQDDRAPALHAGEVRSLRRRETAASGRVPAYHRHPLLQKALGDRRAGWSKEELGEHWLRRHTDGILMAANHLWPGSELAGRAQDRLVRRYFERLDLGEFELAHAIAQELVTTGDAEPLQRLADASGLDALLEALAVWGKEHRRKVARIAGLLGERLVPTIGQALATEEGMSQRRRMLEMMLAIGGPAIPHVQEWLSDERWFVVRNGLFVLRQLKAPGLTDAAARLCDHPEPKVAAEAIRCLAVAGDPEWLQRFRELLGRHSAVARREAFALAAILREPDLGRLLLVELERRKGLRLREEETLDLITALGRFPLPEVASALHRLASLANWRYPFRLTPVWEAVARAAAHQPSPAREEILACVARLHDPAAELAGELLARCREIDS